MHVKKVAVIGLSVIVLVSFAIYKSTESKDVPLNENVYSVDIDQNIIYSDIKKEYEITLDSFNVSQEVIKKNYTLAKLLSDAGLSNSIVNKAVKNSLDVFDIRKIKAGNDYSLYYSKDSSSALKYFVYRHSPTEYLKIVFNDEPYVIRGEKEIINKRKTCSGVVSSSLWATMVENKIDPMMANRLSEIYAWTIDFFGLEEGDRFKVVYDEQLVDSIPIGIGDIYAAIFVHRGEELFAYGFEQDGIKSFFDENGKSLRRQFLKAPLKFSRISSGYSHSRMHPILKIRRPHTGVDYSAPTGTPIYTIGDGTVIAKAYTTAAGNYIKIKHNSVYTTGYNHLSKYAQGIRVGQRIAQGEVIGYVGSTGYATGPHLDFRVWMNGQPIDPLKIKAPPVEPVKNELMASYKNAVDALKEELGSTI